MVYAREGEQGVRVARVHFAGCLVRDEGVLPVAAHKIQVAQVQYRGQVGPLGEDLLELGFSLVVLAVFRVQNAQAVHRRDISGRDLLL